MSRDCQHCHDRPATRALDGFQFCYLCARFYRENSGKLRPLDREMRPLPQGTSHTPARPTLAELDAGRIRTSAPVDPPDLPRRWRTERNL